MFGIGGTEVLVILVVAMLFLGPDKLPEAAKSISKGIRDLRKQTREFTDTIENDTQIGGAIRDLKSALRGEEIRRPPPRKVAPAAVAPAVAALADGPEGAGLDAPAAPGTSASGTAAPGTAAPGTSASGTAAPGTAAPGTAAPGTPASGTPAGARAAADDLHGPDFDALVAGAGAIADPGATVVADAHGAGDDDPGVGDDGAGDHDAGDRDAGGGDPDHDAGTDDDVPLIRPATGTIGRDQAS